MSFRLVNWSLLALIVWVCCGASAQTVDMLPAPVHLRTEYIENPLGLDTTAPRFSWWMQHPGRNVVQSAYQILVATDPALLAQDRADLWDSGKTASDRCVHVVYTGAPLSSYKRCYWKVRTWDQDDRLSAYSEPAWFEMALLAPADFTAQWIRGPQDALATNGYVSEATRRATATEWVQVDLGQALPVSRAALYPARPYNWRSDMPGFGFPVRYRVTLSHDSEGRNVVATADFTSHDQPNPGESPVTVDLGGQRGRYLRVTATQLRKRDGGRFVLALAEIEALDGQGRNLALNKEVSASSSWERKGWGKSHVVDGVRRSQGATTHSPLIRTSFTVDKPVARVRAYVSGLGYYELHLNGKRVGDRVLDPPNTVYMKRTLYSVYDVASLLVAGENAVGMMLGHGWHSGSPAGWLQLRIEYADGSIQTVHTSGAWRWSLGPVVEESLYNGETYDARLEKPGWAAPGYDDSAWQPAAPYENPPASLACQTMPPIRVIGTRAPLTLTRRPDGGVVADFGQNLTGWVRIKVQGAPGAPIVMRHAELLHPDGSLNPENLRTARATDTYILAGRGTETYAPRFTQHGFRYVEVTGYPGELTKDKIEACIVHTDFDRIGAFDSSNTLLNRIYDVTLWSIRGNNMSIPTDCPQRDERMGWMGDAHLAAETTLLNFDATAYYENWLRVIANSQDAEGHVPDTAPSAAFGRREGSPAWAVAYPLLTYYLYHYSGDERVVEEHYDNLVRWFSTLERHAKDGIVEYGHYGDWVGLEDTPMDLISTGVFYLSAHILNEFAQFLGKDADVARFAGRKAEIASAFNSSFFKKHKRCYGNGSQFSQVWPLYLGIVPTEHRQAVLDHLKREIVETRNSHFATGILGTKYIYDVLSDSNNAALAYTATLQTSYPSYGYMLAHGATTLWELWELKTGRGMNSHNHQMFGSVVDWFFDGAVGINKMPAPGYAHIVVAPLPDDRLIRGEGVIDTVRGQIKSRWLRTGSGYECWVTIPPNCRATFKAPTQGLDEPRVTLDGKDVGKALVIDLGSGQHRIDVKG